MPDPGFLPPSPLETQLPRSQQSTLKRSASVSFDVSDVEISRKRMKEEHDDVPNLDDTQLFEELQCGCCSSLVYRPVLFDQCQHFVCGSCCALWIRNGGSNCPTCRAASTSATPFRPLQSVLDALLRAAPHKARTERERQQADELYAGTSMRFPTPKEASPEPDINPSDYVRPCPNCLPGNAYGWRCPEPIVDPNVDPDNAWLVEDGTPPGHALCGNCENLLALPSPLTTRCDFCQVSFCGIGVQGRCIAAPIRAQHPHGLSDVGDLIQSSAVYESFHSNTVEVDIMLDYLTAQRITPRHIYREIVTHIQSQPRAFLPLIELELFVDVHPLPAGVDPDPAAPRSRICRHCAGEVFLYGLRDWFLRERQKGFLEESVLSRKDCADGAECSRQADLVNHMILNAAPAQPRVFVPGSPSEGSGTPQAPDAPVEALQSSDLASSTADDTAAAPGISDIFSVPITSDDVAAVDVPVTGEETGLDVLEP
ncbi:hypothetical protein C8J57DRAFT_1279275 [Mycena rebaudengoi]|nr:hypothetical protein C8J57DRAFT_1279275 [Mycena rebaudengoi]